MAAGDEHTDWQAVIGKALSFLCVQELGRSDLARVGTVLQKVQFLESLGVPRKDAAVMMGSTADSVRVLAAAQKKKGGARAKKASKR